jgi:hypothetical protein
LPTETVHTVLNQLGLKMSDPTGRSVMRRFEYSVALEPERDGALTVTFPDLPEAITSGKDRADALDQAADCLE